MAIYTEEKLKKTICNKLKIEIPDKIWGNVLQDTHEPYDGIDLKETLEKLEEFGFTKIINRRSISNLDLIRSEISASYVKEIVKKCRLEIFGSTDPPFKKQEEMDEWIQKEFKSQPPAEGHAPRFGYKLDLKDIPPEKQFAFIKKCYDEKPGIWGMEYATLSYPHKSGCAGVVIVSDGTPLRRLWATVQSIVKRLDCQEAQAVAFILLGGFPLVKTLSAHAKPTIRNQAPSEGEITITIKAPVSKESVGKIYEVLRKKLWGNSRSTREPNERDMEIIRFVIKYQDKEKPEWSALSKRWNHKFPKYNFGSYRDFKKSFTRAIKKVFPYISPKTLFPK